MNSFRILVKLVNSVDGIDHDKLDRYHHIEFMYINELRIMVI